jgi:hypothetical protein
MKLLPPHLPRLFIIPQASKLECRSPLSELDLRDESRSSDSDYPANGVDQNHWDERNESIEPEKVSPDTSGGGK